MSQEPINRFREIEKNLKCKCGCGMGVHLRLISQLIILENDCNEKFIYNSGARCKNYSIEKKLKESSMHCLGLAVDINCNEGALRNNIIKNIFYRQLINSQKGIEPFIIWQIIEICDKHIHLSLSLSETESQKILWGISK